MHTSSPQALQSSGCRAIPSAACCGVQCPSPAGLGARQRCPRMRPWAVPFSCRPGRRMHSVCVVLQGQSWRGRSYHRPCMHCGTLCCSWTYRWATLLAIRQGRTVVPRIHACCPRTGAESSCADGVELPTRRGAHWRRRTGAATARLANHMMECTSSARPPTGGPAACPVRGLALGQRRGRGPIPPSLRRTCIWVPVCMASVLQSL